MRLVCPWTLVCSVVFAVSCASPPDEVSSRVDALRTLRAVSDFGPNPAGLTMHRYSPSDVPAGPRPLVVALHGCTMSAAGLAEAGWNEIADELGFHVVYPQQSAANNSLSCFNWGGTWPGAPNAFVPSSTPLNVSHIERGGPELESMVSMVRSLVDDGEVDPERVYVSGFSAGGAMAAAALAAYPDVFRAGQIVAGIPYKCASTTGEATSCMGNYSGINASLNRTGEQWAARVASAGAPAVPPPPITIWHGDADFTVNPAASVELVEQWTSVHGARESGSTEVDGATRTTYDAGGRTVVEMWTVPGMGHAVAVDRASECGGTGSYVSDRGICSARHAATFFGLDGTGPIDPPDAGMPTDPSAPTVRFTSPSHGAFVTGVVTLGVEASDPDGLDYVEVFVDDASLGRSMAGTFTLDWSTATLAETAYRIRADAYDLGGVLGSAQIQVVVDHPGGTPPDPIDAGTMPGLDAGPGTDAGMTEPGASGSSIASCSASGTGAGWTLSLLVLLRKRRSSRHEC